MTGRQVTSTTGGAAGNSYNDPIYTTLARRYEQQYGLPSGVLDAIRIRGEQSNADQVSPAGARTVYQFTPGTRRLFIQRYGLDPWSGPEQATQAAAQHLKADYEATGSWNEAIRRYFAGPRRSGTASARSYGERVGDFDGGR